MNTYRCVVLESGSKRVELTIEAQSVEELYQQLHIKNQKLLEIKHVSKKRLGSTNLNRLEILRLLEKIELLLTSGLNIQDSLEISARIVTQPSLKKVLSDMEKMIRKGNSLGQAVEHVIPSMPNIVLAMLMVGEKSGALVSSLNMAITYLKSGQDIRDKIISASFYPLIVMGLLLAGSFGLFVFLLPALERSLGSGTDSSIVSLAVEEMRSIGLSGIIGLLFTIMLFAFFIWQKKNGTMFAIRIERLLLKVPMIGTFLLYRDLFSLSFAMEVLCSVNIPVDESLALVSAGLWSFGLQKNLQIAANKIRSGADISTALGSDGDFPNIYIEWIKISEHTGKPVVAFAQLRKYYESELNKQIHRITVIIEPAMIVFLGLIMLFVVLKLVVPIFNSYLGGGLQI